MTKSGFDIDELERLLAAATPGEWRTEGLDQGVQIWCGSSYVGEARDYTGDDAALIVAARNSLPAILTEIRELRAENARLKDALDEDGLAEIIADTLDMDWQPRWAAQAIRRAALGEPQ